MNFIDTKMHGTRIKKRLQLVIFDISKNSKRSEMLSREFSVDHTRCHDWKVKIFDLSSCLTGNTACLDYT